MRWGPAHLLPRPATVMPADPPCSSRPRAVHSPIGNWEADRPPCRHIKRNDVDLGVSDEIYCVATCYAMFVNGIDGLQYIFLSTQGGSASRRKEQEACATIARQEEDSIAQNKEHRGYWPVTLLHQQAQAL